MENKVSVTFNIPGAVMYTKQQAKEDKSLIKHEKMLVKGNNGKETLIDVAYRKCVPAQQHINLSKEAYDHMTAKAKSRAEDRQNVPRWAKSIDWFNLGKKKRLEAHLANMAECLGAESFTYEILDD